MAANIVELKVKTDKQTEDDLLRLSTLCSQNISDILNIAFKEYSQKFRNNDGKIAPTPVYVKKNGEEPTFGYMLSQVKNIHKSNVYMNKTIVAVCDKNIEPVPDIF